MTFLKVTVSFVLLFVHGNSIAHKNLQIHEGGIKAEIGQYPFATSIELVITDLVTDTYIHICNGIIIHERWALTAASCAGLSSVVVGGNVDLDQNEPTKQIVGIEEFVIHPDFDIFKNPGPNDITLVRLNQSFVFNDVVKPIQLPKQGAVVEGTADLIGYACNETVDSNFYLEYILDLPILDFADCNTAVNNMGINVLDEKSNICVGNPNRNANDCYQDYGGALIQKSTLIGLVSWSIQPCYLSGAPDVFTNVANFVDWINQTIENNK
ncbi:unnamed protein product [Diabrotica balteata]|uniref:Peptidase S1 domain-containing protein n=1 Tax=Diabrotica balteata TaxID=107213 RepID=A0A9N9SSI9_DIABA|nr:unnamed protein product [Diabrotica balteata]